MPSFLRTPLVLLLVLLPLACGGSTDYFVGGGSGWSVWGADGCAWPDCRQPRAVVAADFDGDGRRDLAAGGEGTGALSILLGDGFGEFELVDPVETDVGARVDLLAAGFFDQGGVPDLAVVDAELAELRVFLGAGDGTFALTPGHPVGLDLPGTPLCLRAGPVQGSARDDLVISDEGGFVLVLLSAADGSVDAGPTSPFFVADEIADLTLASFDEDGETDLAVLDPSAGTLEIWAGDGEGAFAPLGPPLPVGPSPAAIEAEFYDYGPTVDVAVLDRDDRSVRVLLGQGDGTFVPWPVPSILLPVGRGLDLVAFTHPLAPFYPAHLVVLMDRDTPDARIVRLFNRGGESYDVGESQLLGGVTDALLAAPLSQDGLSDLAWADFRSGAVRAIYAVAEDR